MAWRGGGVQGVVENVQDVGRGGGVHVGGWAHSISDNKESPGHEKSLDHVTDGLAKNAHGFPGQRRLLAEPSHPKGRRGEDGLDHLRVRGKAEERGPKAASIGEMLPDMSAHEVAPPSFFLKNV